MNVQNSVDLVETIFYRMKCIKIYEKSISIHNWNHACSISLWITVSSKYATAIIYKRKFVHILSRDKLNNFLNLKVMKEFEERKKFVLFFHRAIPNTQYIREVLWMARAASAIFQLTLLNVTSRSWNLLAADGGRIGWNRHSAEITVRRRRATTS